MNVLEKVMDDAANDEKNKAGINKRLESFILRIERVAGEVKALQEDIKEIKSEAKADGYNPKIISLVLKIRKMEDAAREEQDSLIQTYLNNLGM